MAATDKHLNIGVKTDLRDGNGLVKFLNDLAATGNKVAKSLSAINLGSAGGQGAARGGLARALLEQKNLFTGLGEAGRKYAQVLNNEVGQSLRQLDTKLAINERHLVSAIEKHTRLASVLSNIPKGRLDYSSAAGAERGAYGVAEALSKRKGQLLTEAGGIAGNQYSTGQGNQTMQLLSSLPGMGGLGGLSLPGIAGISAAAYMAFKVVKMMAAAPGNYYGAVAQVAGSEANIGAGAGRMSGQYGLGTTLGSAANVYWMNKSRQDPSFANFVRGKRKEAEWGDNFAVQAISHGFVGNWGAWANTAENAVLHGRAVAKNAEVEFANMKRDEDPSRAFAIDYLEQNARSLVAGGRITGLHGGFGARAAGFGNGISLEEGSGILQGLVGSGGRGAMRFDQSVKASILAGMDPGTAAALAGAGAVGGDLLGNLRRTGLDPTAQAMLGQNVLSLMGPGNLLSSQSGLVQALSSGTGFGDSSQQRRALQQNMSGAQGLQSLLAGANPWQKNVNLVNSIGTIPGRGIYAQNALANMDISTALGVLNGGDVPLAWKGMGIGKANIKSLLGNTFKSTVNGRWQDQGKHDPASELMRTIKTRFGGDTAAWGRSIKDNKVFEQDAELLSGLYSAVDPTSFANPNQALGAIRVMSGRARGKGVAGGGKTTETDADTALEMLTEKVNRLNKAITDALDPTTALGTAAHDAAVQLGQWVGADGTVRSVDHSRGVLKNPQARHITTDTMILKDRRHI